MAIAEIPPGPARPSRRRRPPMMPEDGPRRLRPTPRPARAGRRGSSGSTTRRSAIMYGASALFFFVLGGIEALLIRIQLAQPNGKLISADFYNQAFTMHGVTMIFLVVMPMGAAFMNYLMPLQVGARDVAFPRLNALSFWVFLFGGIFLNTSWLLGGAPDGGWFAYAPNTNPIFSPSHGMDFYALGLLITGIASLVGAINLIVTVINLRAPGMSFFKMPVFTWMGARHPVPPRLRHAGHHRRAVPAHLRPALRRQLLQRRGGRRPAAVGAPVLDLRPPGGLHPHPAGLRDHLRDHPDVQPQADLRLPVHGVLGHRHRLHGLGRVGPPHVRLGHRAHLGRRLQRVDDVHRRPDRREDLQLAGHPVGRQAAVHDGR